MVALVEHAQVEADTAEVAAPAAAELAQAGEQAALVEDLGDALGETEGPGFPGRRGQSVVDGDLRAAEPEFTREHETHGTGADHYDASFHNPLSLCSVEDTYPPTTSSADVTAIMT